MTLPRLNALELDNLLASVGFSDATATTSPTGFTAKRAAWAKAMAESGGTPGIIGGPNPDGSFDHGLFQINDKAHAADPLIDWRNNGALLLDAKYNAQIAYRLTSHGKDWSAWGLGELGWAGTLKVSNPTAWAQVQKSFDGWYSKYPAAILAAKQAESRPTLHLVNLKLGVRNNADVRTYQTALRTHFTAGTLAKLNPSGATGNYGAETQALTQAFYEKVARVTGSNSWLIGDLTTPGRSLLDRMGFNAI